MEEVMTFPKMMKTTVVEAVVALGSGRTCILSSEKLHGEEHCELGERQACRYTASQIIISLVVSKVKFCQ
jgi:hypothetical protein